MIKLPEGVIESEANLILEKFAEVKAKGIGKLEVGVLLGKLVDVTVSLKENHKDLKELYNLV